MRRPTLHRARFMILSFVPLLLALSTYGLLPIATSTAGTIADGAESRFATPRLEPGVTALDPGGPPEADDLGAVAFTADGRRVLVVGRSTDNVTIFDWETSTVAEMVDVGQFPRDVAVTDRYAVVPCMLSDEAYVIDLTNDVPPLVFPTGSRPVVVRTSPDGRHAYVACDADDVCEVIDLATRSHVRTITGFPVDTEIGWVSTLNGRRGDYYSNFEISPDGAHLIVGNNDDLLLFISTTTGAVEHAIELEEVRYVCLSGDGSKLIAISNTNPLVAHQVDLTSHAVQSVTLPPWSHHHSGALAVDWTGSKAILGSNNYSYIVRFVTQEYRSMWATGSPYWIGTSPDHRLAICGHKLTVLEFATETIIGQGGNREGGVLGAVSPVGDRVASHDPWYYEGLRTYTYSTSDGPVYHGLTLAGRPPEADAPKRVAITPDGTTALVLNELSANITVLDLATLEQRAMISFPEQMTMRGLAVTPDSRWLVVTGYSRDTVELIDLDTFAIVASVPSGEGPSNVSIAPDGGHAYVCCAGSNTVSVIELAGANSQRIAEIPTGGTGFSGLAHGMYNDVRVSPTGEYVLVAAGFDDQVDIIDTATHAVVTSVPVGGFPFRIGFTDDGEYAISVNKNGDNYNLIHLDGAASAVVATHGTNQIPFTVAYNPLDDTFHVGTYWGNSVHRVDARTGDLLGTTSYSQSGHVTQVLIDEAGVPIVLTAERIIRDGHAIELPDGRPTNIAYSPLLRTSVATIPGPDCLVVVDWEMVGGGRRIPTEGWQERPVGDIGFPSLGRSFRIHQSSATSATIQFQLPATESIRLRILDVTGREVITLADRPFGPGPHALQWKADRQPSGIYFYELTAGRQLLTRKGVLIR